MKREVLLHDECTALASHHGLGDLCTHASTLHNRAKAQTGAWTPMVIVRAFLFNPDAGELAALFAFAGTGSQETEGFEGVRVTFEPHEILEAHAALVEASTAYDDQFIADDLAERIRTADNQPGSDAKPDDLP